MKRPLFNRTTLLTELAENVEHQLNEVNDVYLPQNTDILSRPAENGGWSIVQCLDHLNTYAAWYLPLIRQTLETGAFTDAATYKSSWFGNYSIGMMKDTSKKYKAAAMHLPRAGKNNYAVLVQFIVHQRELLKLIDLAQNADLGTGKIAVSIMRFFKLNLGDALQFMVAHQQRHLLQARRDLRSQRKATGLSIADR